ncbi:putative Integral membrane protein [Seiridium cardinale]|uniref:Integral membrane protein n=1 Tax=Seiridium cardinale TaxID=138064 RepID=A0ABR2XC22_9PEZI
MSNSTTTAVTDQPLPKVGQQALLGVVWALVAAAFGLVVARLVIRYRFSRRFQSDDYITVFALLILIGNAVVITLMAPPMYEILYVSVGLEPITAGFMDRASVYLKLQFTSTVLFWTCLWTVKACFLAFFRRLTAQLKWPSRAWLAIAILTGLTYCGAIITYPVSCTSFVLGECSSELHVSRSLISLRYSTAVDIITDLLIISLPIYLTIGLKMSAAQKLGLVGVLSLGIIVTAFSVIRIIVTNTVARQPEISWLALWSSIESSIAVMVACLSSFKVLLTHKKKSSRSPHYGSEGYSNSRRTTRNRRSRVDGKDIQEDTQELQNMRGHKRPQDITVTHTVVVSDGKMPHGYGKERVWSDDESQEQMLV